ncbi:MAG: hypothetical protein ABJE66_35715 [Deltaproteobacteria bacterium]
MALPATAVSDPFVFFGATGDLAHKMVFSALHELVKAGRLDVPIVGVARKPWTLDQLRDRAAFDKLASLPGRLAQAASEGPRVTRDLDQIGVDPISAFTVERALALVT